ncbi:hypothetical protein FDUTEX481_02323 [Tolypothrix sp. PCC 7601]|nr:hypothetical protein FDUTEX481_02323 [Tolypothrix sp. PCC 7601]
MLFHNISANLAEFLIIFQEFSCIRISIYYYLPCCAADIQGFLLQ